MGTRRKFGERRQGRRSTPSYPPISGLADIFHEQEEMEVVGGARFELWYEVQVEIPRFCCLSVLQQTATADPIRQLEQSGEHILDKGRS
jgi:hypothetical protein